MTNLFVTSTGTDIGKTWICCQLLAQLSGTLNIRCIKPVVSGFDPEKAAASDTGRLLAAQNIPIDADRIAATSPWRFRAPLSVDMAAAREHRQVSFDELLAFSGAPAGIDLNLIEGVGGVMAPIDQTHTVVDWIAALDTQVLLVAGSYLGSLSHTLTAVDVLERANRRPALIVLSQSESEPVPTEESAACIARFCPDIPVSALPRGGDAAAAAEMTARVQRILEGG